MSKFVIEYGYYNNIINNKAYIIKFIVDNMEYPKNLSYI